MGAQLLFEAGGVYARGGRDVDAARADRQEVEEVPRHGGGTALGMPGAGFGSGAGQADVIIEVERLEALDVPFSAPGGFRQMAVETQGGLAGREAEDGHIARGAALAEDFARHLGDHLAHLVVVAGDENAEGHRD